LAKNYGNESMRIQSDLEAMREFPNNYLGTDDIAGATQTIKEILSNSVDEANAGYGDKIILTIDSNGAVTVEDFGRGLPMDFNKSQNEYNWHIAFCTLHGGGKFKGSRDNYNSSAGQHGIGAAATQLSSEFCNVIVKRDGYVYDMKFKKGVPVGELKRKKATNKMTGTKITWKPDLDVFTDIDFDTNEINEWVYLQSIVNEGITFIFKDERVNLEKEYYIENGIFGYVDKQLKENGLTDAISFECKGTGRDTAKRLPYEVKAKVVFGFTENAETLYFHNSIPLEYGGSPKRAMETAFTQFFTEALKKVGKIKGELKFEDIRENLLFISSTYTQIPPSFENQTKKSISNKFIQDFLTGQILQKLQEWSTTNAMEFDKVLTQISINNESRVSAAAHRVITKQKLTKNVGGISNRVENFTDCRSKDETIKQLYICEGKSALSSLKQARNPEYQALYPIRGKIRSVYKISTKEALKNNEVQSIVTLVGTGIKEKCNIDDIRFSKIIISCDQDDDGLHIQALLVTLFYTLMPQVITEGYLYALQTPLYEIHYKDGTEALAYTEKELIDLTKGKQCKVSRNKGLGELDASTMSLCLAPETQKLTQFTMEDVKHAQEFIELFMGTDSGVRQEYIGENMYLYELLEE
jgi:DNA gyrase subunit B